MVKSLRGQVFNIIINILLVMITLYLFIIDPTFYFTLHQLRRNRRVTDEGRTFRFGVLIWVFLQISTLKIIFSYQELTYHCDLLSCRLFIDKTLKKRKTDCVGMKNLFLTYVIIRHVNVYA